MNSQPDCAPDRPSSASVPVDEIGAIELEEKLAPDLSRLRFQPADPIDLAAAAIRVFPFDDFGMDDVSFALADNPLAQEWVPALAAAVLAVLPAPADRAAILREAADAIEEAQHLRDDTVNAALGFLDNNTEQQHRAVHRSSALLRRLAAASGPHDTTERAEPQIPPPVGYSGKGRVWCLTCPRPDGEDAPVTVNEVDHWEECARCGRHVVDVAEAVVFRPDGEA